MGFSGESMKKLAKSKQLTLSDGEIHLFDFRMGMLPIRTLTKIFENIYGKLGDEAFEVFFEAGIAHGQMAIDEIGKVHEVPRKQFIKQTLYTADTLGLGKFRLEKTDFEDGVVVFRIDNSPFAKEFRESEELSDIDRPIDDLQRGMFHRVSKVVLESESVESKETHCIFQGDSYCRFVCEEAD